MSNTAAHLVDSVLPALPYRQWGLSVPRRVRIMLATNHDLLSAVLEMAMRKIFAWQRRAARKLGIADPMCGAIAFVQRFGSLLNLNCHFHNVLPDGVFVEDAHAEVEFRPVPPPMKRDVQRLVEQIARGTEKLIAKRASRFEDDEEISLLASEQTRRLNERTRVANGIHGCEGPASRRQAFHYGYSLHAERIVNSDDRDGLEKLCRYASRAPIAKSRARRSALAKRAAWRASHDAPAPAAGLAVYLGLNCGLATTVRNTHIRWSQQDCHLLLRPNSETQVYAAYA